MAWALLFSQEIFYESLITKEWKLFNVAFKTLPSGNSVSPPNPGNLYMLFLSSGTICFSHIGAWPAVFALFPKIFPSFLSAVLSFLSYVYFLTYCLSALFYTLNSILLKVKYTVLYFILLNTATTQICKLPFPDALVGGHLIRYWQWRPKRESCRQEEGISSILCF